MQYIESRDVSIIVSGASSFEMSGTIEGSPDSFIFESTNSHFYYWFPKGKIDSLEIDKKNLKQEQIEIVEACERKIKEFFE